MVLMGEGYLFRGIHFTSIPHNTIDKIFDYNTASNVFLTEKITPLEKKINNYLIVSARLLLSSPKKILSYLEEKSGLYWQR